jgi:hypothetical protein
MREDGRMAEWRPSAWRRRAGYGIGMVTTVTVVALMMGGAGATPLMHAAATVKYTVPYSGSAFGVMILGTAGCAAAGAIPVIPSFNGTTGVALASGKVAVKGCGPGNDTADMTLGSEWDSSSFTTTTGLHNLSSHWLLNFTVSLEANPLGTGANAVAEFSLGVYVSLYDSTNNTTYTGHPGLVASKTIYSATYSHTYKKVSADSYLDLKLSKTHHYEWLADVVFTVFAFATTGPSSAMASVNIGSGGREATLLSVTDS